MWQEWAKLVAVAAVTITVCILVILDAVSRYQIRVDNRRCPHCGKKHITGHRH